MSSAKRPTYDNRPVHLRCTREQITDAVLLPGDPGRVHLYGEHLDDYTILSQNREYVVGRGTFEGAALTVCSTGIGSPSTEIAVAELAALGAKVLIRTGGCGAIQPHIECGDLVIHTGCVRLGGTTQHYVRSEYPAVADHQVTAALIQAADDLGCRFHVGIGATISSYYAGQARPVLDDIQFGAGESFIAEMAAAKVLSMEMEAETVLTLSSLLGLQGGSICVVHGNRMTDQWLDDYEPAQHRLLAVACRAGKILASRYMS